MNPQAHNYVADCIKEIRELADIAREDCARQRSDSNIARLTAFYEVLSLFQAEAKVFEVSLESVGLDVDLERLYLLQK